MSSRGKLSIIPQLCALTVAVLFTGTGCVKFTSGMLEHGYVADSYVSAITPPAVTAARPNAAIRIAPLAHVPATWDMGGVGGVFRLFPLVSFLATPVVITNQISDDTNSRLLLKPNECEQLLIAELTKAGIARGALAADTAADFEIRGRMDFSAEMDMHFSGFGDIIYCFTILPVIAPMNTTHLIATAHLELVSLRTNKILLTKDYTQRCRYFNGAVTGNSHRYFTGFGAEVLPPLIRQYTEDLHALPAGTWAASPL